MLAFSPGIFTSQFGSGPVVAVNQDGSISQAPATVAKLLCQGKGVAAFAVPPLKVELQADLDFARSAVG